MYQFRKVYQKEQTYCIQVLKVTFSRIIILFYMFQILYCKRTAQEVYDCLTKSPNNPEFIKFRDASIGPPCYQISLSDCLSAIYKCHRLGFFNFEDFCVKEYEHYERVENGDLNWIVPGKFIAFCGPHARSKVEDGMCVS